MPINRGCGQRKPGGLYMCCGLSPDGGYPIEHYIIDPPLPYGEFHRAPILFEKNGVSHVLMWVGAEYYPYASDFIEETRRYGASKRIPKNFPIEKLSRGSKMFLVHSKAIIDNYMSMPIPKYCPKANKKHLQNSEYCIGHIYQIASPNKEGNLRQIGDTIYQVYPCNTEPVALFPGIFLTLPITHFDYVKEIDGRVDHSIVNKRTEIKINIVDE